MTSIGDYNRCYHFDNQTVNQVACLPHYQVIKPITIHQLTKAMASYPWDFDIQPLRVCTSFSVGITKVAPNEAAMKDLKTDSAGKLKVKETIVVREEPGEVDSAAAVCVESAQADNVEIVEAPSKSFPEPAPDLGARYDVLDFVGSGGMGTVWKVYDKELKETFAIKVLKPELLSDDVSLKRFQQEASLASDLTHANIAAIFGPGEDTKGRPYIIMRYVEGESLAQLLERTGPLEPERAMELFWQINDALAHSHLKGITHRDIKPSNIIISRTESGGEIAQLVDFGISSSIHEKAGRDQTLTQTGNVLGSPRYMSPEQFLGQDVGPESDMYSLGCVLYEMFTGTPPFTDANPVKLILQHLNEKPNLEFVPQKFRILVGSLLEKSPHLRIQATRSFHTHTTLGYRSNSDIDDTKYYVAAVPMALSMAALFSYVGGNSTATFASAGAILLILLVAMSEAVRNNRHTIVDETHSVSMEASKIGSLSGLAMIILQPFCLNISPILVPFLVVLVALYFLYKIKPEPSIQISPSISSNRRIASKDEIEVELKRRGNYQAKSINFFMCMNNLTYALMFVFTVYSLLNLSERAPSPPQLATFLVMPLGLAIYNAFMFQKLEHFAKRKLFQEELAVPRVKNIAKGIALTLGLITLCWVFSDLTMPHDYKYLVKAIDVEGRSSDKAVNMLFDAPHFPNSEMGDLARLQILTVFKDAQGLNSLKSSLYQQIIKNTNYENNAVKALAYANLALTSDGNQQAEFTAKAIDFIKANESFKLENPILSLLKQTPDTKAKTVETLAEIYVSNNDLKGLKELYSTVYNKGRPFWSFYAVSQRDKLLQAIHSLELKSQLRKLPKEGAE